ncbi:uncharacterized protein Z518_09106 [Rhinocladiella mackenziei CBS 650.93]|uniref:Amino acid transporter n=1 Tax=Rhinocladiella mackenziei CBS 650.93 TaxID=1442369 RepID=A0A0D2IDQ9_9EURO|nr:uncharacterized protein Z518_09106 [Rhinocladiella mackenziei CBS 650.93]KIX01381.1 hypothetical protein Z518_09106 [Rhinocladiella mackenziei CBS 650.93]
MNVQQTPIDIKVPASEDVVSEPGPPSGVADQHDVIQDDDLDLMELTGHKPVLQRNYSRFALLAFSFMIVDSWSGIIGSLATGISSGGTVMLIYGSIAVTIFTMAVALSLAEIASAYPTSGGQYHWTAVLSPKKYSAILSWFCGYFNAVGWCVVCASITVILGQFFMAMIILTHPDITYHRWQGFVVYQAFNLLCSVVNAYGRKALPYIHGTGFYICLTAFFLVNMTMLGTAFPKNSAKFVFGTFTNNTGWKSNGIAFIVGLTNPAFSYGGLDSAVHMAEEMKDARKNLPFVLISTVCIGFVTLIVTAITICFCMIDLDKILATSTGVPILEIFYQATESKGASIFLLSVLFYLTTAAILGSQQTASRLIWAFARDEALPFSKQLSTIDTRQKVPVNSTILCWAIVAVLGCVYLGSSTAFNALVGCNVLLANISFAFPIGLLLFGRRKYLEHATFSLGNKIGPAVNAIALAWIVFMVIFFDFPFTMPVHADNMNYSSVIIGAVVLFSSAYWLWKGHDRYKGPKMEVGIDAAFNLQLAKQTREHRS